MNCRGLNSRGLFTSVLSVGYSPFPFFLAELPVSKFFLHLYTSCSQMENAFEQTIINRLRTLNHTQRSIEKTSRAFLKNRHMAKELVKLWFKEFRSGKSPTFMSQFF